MNGQASLGCPPKTFMMTVFFRGHSVAFALRQMKFTPRLLLVVSGDFHTVFKPQFPCLENTLCSLDCGGVLPGWHI